MKELLFISFLVSALGGATRAHAAEIDGTPTHSETDSIAIKLDKDLSTARIHTFAVDPEGRILAACGGSVVVYERTASGTKEVEKEMPSAVVVMDNQGTVIDLWKLSVTPQALTVDRDGTVYAAGQGKIIRLGKKGEETASALSPHVQTDPELLAFYNKEICGAGSEESSAEMKKKEKKGLLNNLVDGFLVDKRDDSQDKMAMLRKLAVNGMAVNDKSVYVTCRQPKGYGYAIYRMSKDLKEPKLVTQGLSGCCGQMDIQARGDVVYAAENSRFRVVGFNDEGKKVFELNGDNKRGELEGFGSCCNPMNLRFDDQGNIYTAEASVGRIKKYSPDGKLLSVVGTVKVVPGCKNVAISVHGDYAYMLDITRNKIAVLKKN